LFELAHFCSMPTPMRSQFIRLLNDLFMAFHQRSVGAAAALIKAVPAEAKAQGCGVVLWITHGHNYWFRSLYDKLAEKKLVGYFMERQKWR
jgi:hypothetical protein